MMSPSCKILVMHRETNAHWQVYLSGFLAQTRRWGPSLGLGLFLGLSVPDIDAIYNTKINRKMVPDMAVPKCYLYTIEVLIFGLKTTTSVLKWQNWPNIWSLKCLSLSFISRHIASNFWSSIVWPFVTKECLIEVLSHLLDFIFRMWSTSSTIMGLPTQWRHDSFNFRDWWSLPPWIEPEPKWSTFCHKEPQIRWINMGKYEYMYACKLYMKEGGF